LILSVVCTDAQKLKGVYSGKAAQQSVLCGKGVACQSRESYGAKVAATVI